MPCSAAARAGRSHRRPSRRRRPAAPPRSTARRRSRTRRWPAFEVAAHDEGAHVTYSGPEESQLGYKESMKDTARVLGRMYDGIEYRGFSQDSVEILGAHAGVPVWNGLTDTWRPTQMLADILTMRDYATRPLRDVTFCYLGDGRNNVANSLLVTGAMLGMDTRICAPDALQPSRPVWEIAARLAKGLGRPADGHRRSRRRRRGRSFSLHRRLAGHGRAPQRVGQPHRPAHSLPGERRRAGGHRQSGRAIHALPACPAQPRDRGRTADLRQARPPAAPVHRRAVRVTATGLLPSGRQPDAHHQGAHGGHTRCGRLQHGGMKIVVALGGNALLQRAERPDCNIQESHVASAVDALTPLLHRHDPVIAHGNGPQVGVLAVESARDPALSRRYPFDVLGAQTQGMIGYWLAQAPPAPPARTPPPRLLFRTT